MEGFTTNKAQEKQFIQWVASCRYGRVEIESHTGVIPMVAGALTVACGPLSQAFGYPMLNLPFIVSGLILLLLGGFRFGPNATRKLANGQEDEWACYDGTNGLVPRLFEGEQLLGTENASAPIRNGVRRLMGGLQVGWGLVLAGLPLATVASGGADVEEYQFWISGFAVVGLLVVARGVRDLLFLKPVIRWALTDRRIVGMAQAGAARSLWMEELAHKPVVVPRSKTTCTVAFDLRRLRSVGMFPMRGLWGVDEMEREEGQRWAQAVVDLRGELGAEGNG